MKYVQMYKVMQCVYAIIKQNVYEYDSTVLFRCTRHLRTSKIPRAVSNFVEMYTGHCRNVKYTIYYY